MYVCVYVYVCMYVLLLVCVCACVTRSPHELGIVQRSISGVSANNDDSHVCRAVSVPQLLCIAIHIAT